MAGGGRAFQPVRRSPRPDAVAPHPPPHASRNVSRGPGAPRASRPTAHRSRDSLGVGVGEGAGTASPGDQEAASTRGSFRISNDRFEGLRTEGGAASAPAGSEAPGFRPAGEKRREGAPAHLSCSCGTRGRSRCGTSSRRCRSGTCTHCPPGDRGALLRGRGRGQLHLRTRPRPASRHVPVGKVSVPALVYFAVLSLP